MASVKLPEAEKIFIINGIQENIRSDGRGNQDFRTIEFETDVIDNCNGSCVLKIGDTKVLAGVKAELTTPPEDSVDEGWIEVTIESTPHAHLDFEGKGGEDLSSEISQMLTKVCNNYKLVDLKSLCVIPGKQVWVLYVDIMVLGYSGNFIDASSLATKIALYETKIQSVTVKNDGENEPEIVVSDDPYDVFTIDVTKLPILITLYRIGNEFIIDATREEETCCICKIVYALSPTQIGMMKLIAGFGSLHIESAMEAIEVVEAVGFPLQKELLAALEREKTIDKKKKIIF